MTGRPAGPQVVREVHAPRQDPQVVREVLNATQQEVISNQRGGGGGGANFSLCLAHCLCSGSVLVIGKSSPFSRLIRVSAATEALYTKRFFFNFLAVLGEPIGRVVMVAVLATVHPPGQSTERSTSPRQRYPPPCSRRVGGTHGRVRRDGSDGWRSPVSRGDNTGGETVYLFRQPSLSSHTDGSHTS